MISTKGRYALRTMVCLAREGGEQWISLEQIANSEGISKKYLENVVRNLVHDGLVEGVRGKGGGYRITRKPQDYTAAEIIESAEGSLSPVACLKDPDYNCPRSQICQTLPLWKQLDSIIHIYLGSLSLQDILEGHYPDESQFASTLQKWN